MIKKLLIALSVVVAVFLCFCLFIFIKAHTEVQHPETAQEMISADYFDWYHGSDRYFSYNGSVYRSAYINGLGGAENHTFAIGECGVEWAQGENVLANPHAITEGDGYYLLSVDGGNETLLLIPKDEWRNHTKNERPLGFYLRKTEDDNIQPAAPAVKDLGVPHGERYDSSEMAIRILDMTVFDGMLYVGGGNYNANAGPVDMWRYRIADEKWERLGSVPDEEVNEFAVIGGVLTVPGTDPRDIGWDKCNYYYLENGEWKTKNTLPGASHCWDITESGGAIFAAIQYEADTSAHYAAMSEDGGESFSVIPLTDENGAAVPSGSIGRYYHLLHIGGELYAYCTNKIYKYDGTRFAFAYDWNGKVSPGNAAGIAKELGAVVYTDNALYFSSTALYECTDPASPVQIAVPDSGTVNDLYVSGGELYVLTVEKSAAENVSRVYKYSGGKFISVAEFRREVPAVCFAVTDNRIYLGLASNNKHNDNGRVIEIERLD